MFDVISVIVEKIWWILIALLVVYISINYVRRKKLPPGPWGLPIVGSVFDISEKTIHLDLMRFGKKYGEIYTIRTGKQLNIILNSERIIKQAFLQRGSDFADRPADTDDPYNIPYNDLFNAHKKLGITSLRNFGFGTPESEQKLMIHIDQLVQYLHSLGGKQTDVREMVQKMTSAMINQMVFGEFCKLDDKELHKQTIAASNWVNLFFSETVFMFFIYNMFPLWLGKLIYGDKIKMVDGYTSDLFGFMKEKIRKYMEDHSNPDDPANIADVYVKAKEEDKFTFDYLVATLMMFIPDAVDTSCHQICWNILILSQRPDLQAELQEELHQAIGDRPIQLSDRKHSPLPKLTAFLLEAYRFSSLTVTALPHCALKEGLTLDGYDIPRSANILSNVYGAIHYNPDIFPDPDTFTLDHFLNKDGEIINEGKIQPYSIGRRMCMGETLAKAQMFLTTATLLQKFTFTFPPGDPGWDIDFRNTGSCFRKPPPFSVCAIPRV